MAKPQAPVLTLENLEMKKTLVALAALSAMSAFAQSSVTIYGALDAGYANSTLSSGGGAGTTLHKANVTGGSSYTSRIGFTGVEDLGAGQSAGFTYEVALSSLGGDAANSGAFATSQTSGLRTGAVYIKDAQLGQVTAGYGMTLRHSQAATLDMTGGANLAGNLMTAVGVGHATTAAPAGTTAGAYTNMDYLLRANGVAYTTPTMGGVSVTYGHVFGDNQTNTNNTSAETANSNLRADMIGLSYANGPLTVLASTTRTVADNGIAGATGATNGQARTNTIVGAIYDFGFAKVSAGAYQDKNQYQNQAGGVDTGDILNRGYQVGIRGAIPGTKAELLTQMAHGSYTTGGEAAEQRMQAGRQFGAIYNFSKRTSAYALYGTQTRDVVGQDAAVDKVYAVGLRHNF